MSLKNNLIQLGLSEKQAMVYLAALELGTDSVNHLAEKARLKRPNTYIIIEELLQKGLLSKTPGEKGNTYTAEPPEKLESILKAQQSTLEISLPLLKALHNSERGKPQVRVYEGAEGMRQIYTETIWKSKTEILFFSSIRKIKETVPGLLEKWIEDLSVGNTNQTHTREFLNPDPVDVEYGLEATKLNKHQQARVIPEEINFRFANADSAIFEDKIMLISFQEKLFVTLVQSEVIANNLRTLFEIAWSTAIPVDKFIKENPGFILKK